MPHISISKILKKNKFKKITNNSDKLLEKCFITIFKKNMGERLGKDIISLLEDKSQRSKNELFSNYNLLYEALKNIFGKRSTIELTSQIHRLLLNEVNMENSLLSINEILDLINEKETITYLHNITNNQHPKIFFTNYEYRDKLLKEFLQASFIDHIPVACFSESESCIENISCVKYDSLIQGKRISSQIVNDFFVSEIQKNKTKKPTRFACQDTVWFKEHGFFQEHQNFSQQINPNVLSHSSILCCYNLNKLDENEIQTILKTTSIVILAESYYVFKLEE